MEKYLKISSFTDESGQDTGGKEFVVFTTVIQSGLIDSIENHLQRLETKSGKSQKWFKSSNIRRKKFVALLLKSNFLPLINTYYSVYKNKDDYPALVGSHIAKAIIGFTQNKKYKVVINIDKTSNKTMENIKVEIKKYRIRFRKIRGVSETNSSIIRLSDTFCGLYRDLGNKNRPEEYKRISKYFKLV